MWVKKNNNKIEFDIFLKSLVGAGKTKKGNFLKKEKKATLSREQGQRSTVGHSREV